MLPALHGEFCYFGRCHEIMLCENLINHTLYKTIGRAMHFGICLSVLVLLTITIGCVMSGI
jgi:hypothetical protein